MSCCYYEFLEINLLVRDNTYEIVMKATLLIYRILSGAKVVIFNGIPKNYR